MHQMKGCILNAKNQGRTSECQVDEKMKYSNFKKNRIKEKKSRGLTDHSAQENTGANNQTIVKRLGKNKI